MDFINGLIGSVLSAFNSITGNYILALLLFAVVAKLIFLPLDIKQQRNSIKQAKMRPKELAIRNKYKGRTDRATQMKMQQEIQDMYQKEGYSPFSGCLPMLIQLPLIFILYAVIRSPLSYICGIGTELVQVMADSLGSITGGTFNTADQLKMVTGIRELIAAGGENLEAFKAAVVGASADFDFAAFSDSLPNFNLFGQDFGRAPSELGFFSWLLLVPVLNFIVQYFSTKLMKKFQPQPIGQDESAQTSLKIMEFTFPLMTFFFAFNMSAAIGVYWIFQNIVSLLERFVLSKAMPLPTYTEAEIKEMEKAAKSQAKAKQSGSTPPRADGERPRSLHRIDEDDDDEPAPAPKKKAEEKPDEAKEEKEETKKEPTEKEKKNAATAEKMIGEAPALKDESDKYNKKKK